VSTPVLDDLSSAELMPALNHALAGALPAELAGRVLPDLPADQRGLSDSRVADRKLIALATQFAKFGVVGGLGLVWDTLTVYGLRPFIGLTSATLVAYFVAATLNWLLNRFWTFRGAGCRHHLVMQWLRFLAANGPGFALNRGTVLVLLWSIPLCRQHPVMALAAGSVAGMFANFTLSRRLVFR
jgi:putative flippase GtrA